ncbi:MAG: hypothetical protein CO113_10715 [Elusimicrobia bacterium CG_4_9_14_3_um_filter_62_55]|nr:MAG: hypothetical protein COR54_14040 [Elusimicrobia bacterium CG22_combo_CG10-13_8_21_14_all_63_91]PJA17229.1 MAG: hypothetical protein COX66_05240 [Elusimicrobia bacterium CG_4_10_14_0_2_um_filter_63_34]PJB25039.1 MAG: hypothetical protein CO113_10715 [Elusimicrobia bacterium CG_4_9_14_3_um_filter_62_55]
MIGLSLLRGSLFQLRTNPLRTMLTLLGVVFGVASVVAMMSIGEGAQREILSAIEAMGADVVHIQAKKIPPEKVGEFINDSVGLNRSDISAVEGLLSGVRGAGYRKTIELKVSDLDTPVHAFSLLAMSEEMPRVHDLRAKEQHDAASRTARDRPDQEQGQGDRGEARQADRPRSQGRRDLRALHPDELGPGQMRTGQRYALGGQTPGDPGFRSLRRQVLFAPTRRRVHRGRRYRDGDRRHPPRPGTQGRRQDEGHLLHDPQRADRNEFP